MKTRRSFLAGVGLSSLLLPSVAQAGWWRRRECRQPSHALGRLATVRIWCDLVVQGVEFVTLIDATGQKKRYEGSPDGKSYPKAFAVDYGDISDSKGDWKVTTSRLPLDHATDPADQAQLWVPAQVTDKMMKVHDFTGHKFTIRTVPTTPDEHTHLELHVECEPQYPDGALKPYLIKCCYKCGSQSYCIAQGNCIMCNGVKVCC